MVTDRLPPNKKPLWLALCLLLAFTLGFGTQQVWASRKAANAAEPMAVFWEAWTRTEQIFYGPIPSARDRTYGAIHEALSLLGDPYTTFVEPQPRELERDRLRGTFGGIGVDVWRNLEGDMVLSPFEDSPAQRAGIADGDILSALNSDIVDDTTSVDSVSARLHGEVGTPVTLTITRPPNPPFDRVIIREQIRVPSVSWRVIEGIPDTGYIHVESFTEQTGVEVVEALQALEETSMAHLILDLRNNYGGLIDPAVTTASQFIAEGTVLHEQRRGGSERTIDVKLGSDTLELPMVVLVNGGTASASEIVAGALQDQGRAKLIGETTYGKGSVQMIYEVSDGSSLHVTTAIWLTPDRNRIDGLGLTPDIQIIDDPNTPQDEQLERAIEYVRRQ